MLQKVRLLKAVEHDSVTYSVGQYKYLEVDPGTAARWKADGVAEDYTEPTKDDTPTTTVVAGTPAATTSDDVAEIVSKKLDTLLAARTKAPTIEVGEPEILKDKKFGFSHFGEQAVAIYRACRKISPVVDERLAKVAGAVQSKAAATTFGSEAVGIDGGYLVAPEFSNRILEHMLDETALLPLTDNFNTASNSVNVLRDETTPWDSTNGVQTYWMEEGVAITQSKPQLKMDSMRLKKLAALVPMTEETLEDAPFVGSYLSSKVGTKMAFDVDEAIVNGTGANRPLGIMNSSALITATRTGASTFDLAEGLLMLERLVPTSWTSARWLINPGIIPKLYEQNSGSVVHFFPPQPGLSAAPAGSYLGIPVIITQHCQALNTAGDVILADLGNYMTVTKAGGIGAADSMHLFFDADTHAFRFTYRIAGQPWTDSAITAQNGNSLSYYIALAAA